MHWFSYVRDTVLLCLMSVLIRLYGVGICVRCNAGWENFLILHDLRGCLWILSISRYRHFLNQNPLLKRKMINSLLLIQPDKTHRIDNKRLYPWMLIVFYIIIHACYCLVIQDQESQQRYAITLSMHTKKI